MINKNISFDAGEILEECAVCIFCVGRRNSLQDVQIHCNLPLSVHGCIIRGVKIKGRWIYITSPKFFVVGVLVIIIVCTRSYEVKLVLSKQRLIFKFYKTVFNKN